MTNRIMQVLVFGLVGAAILIALGVWQVRRMAWKEGILAEIEARIAAAPVALPAQPDPVEDKYLPVRVTGDLEPGAIRVLASRKQVGAGYRVISALDLGDRRILVDRGFVPVADAIPDVARADVTITGNLHWPDEVLSSTPLPDRSANIWFARDVGLMAAELGTQPVMVVARATSFDDGPVAPLPVGTAGIPNDHLEYAVTWFALAFIWLAMTGYLLWGKRRKDKTT